jgi:hypothetical protein
MGRLTSLLFALSPSEASFSRRGFRPGDAPKRERLEQIGRAFILGYNSALDTAHPLTLAASLHETHPELTGFAFEGAAMALALLDHLMPWSRSRWRTFAEGPGSSHVYMMHVGMGWAWARLPWVRQRVDAAVVRLDPVLRWLAVDGYGFHQGYFHWPMYIKGRASPRHLEGYARRAFDQGLGRSLWFVYAAEPSTIRDAITAFPTERRADLWSGVGLACAYAGDLDRSELSALHAACKGYEPQVAQGAAFAAKARLRGGNPADHTDRTCHVLCGRHAAATADVVDRAYEDLPSAASIPAYEIWRQRVQHEFASMPA